MTDHLPTGMSLPTGTVTFLFTDIEGSTPLWEKHPQKMAESLQIHNAVLRQAIETHNGVVFKIVGDSFQAAFSTAPQALKAAIDGQRALQTAPWNDLGPLKVRMGLHTGEAQLDPGGDEYAVSHTKNRAARIMSAAHGGQVLLSQETADLVVRKLPENGWLKDLGEYRLKGMSIPEHLHQACAERMPQVFPPLMTLSLPRHNLPIQLSDFIGRQKEIKQVKEFLRLHRLVTLTGSGGVGKTRLGLAVAEESIDDFSDGVWFIDLSTLKDPGQLVTLIADMLGIQVESGKPILETLCYYFSGRSCLLFLDNCEQSIEACFILVDQLLHAARQTKILVTSRELLGITGGVILRVPPLGFPLEARRNQ